ncbi:glycosyltransferase family 2 protein [Niabella drilacis]|uniref:Glycosyl transferase family 2 n=1 Tax=Niabella drilacis (strain DSM 25811 / CCM 8410 / CCUG 62505 / LMG 26954 / E90) TaxID=1285928 RepID=A0A1G7B2B2_NIADE|nr:glycosyltransferase family 2 protein [Niabella drilacis]SDE20406.1 Glycosyl transferase family 2 [Niabella drilacis]
MLEVPLTMHKIIILVPFRNVRPYIIDCINSIIGQHYNNYEVFLLDDASDDGTLDLIDGEVEKFHRVRNKKRLGLMENIYKALMELPIKDEDIVIQLDGDDYLLGEYVLQIINATYDSNTLLSYGQFIDNYGRMGFCSPYSKEEFASIRSVRWKASHIKTFKYKLFKAFLRQDPHCENLKTETGQFYEYASDIALMFPLMEIAGFENTAMIQNIVYCYRRHPNNDGASTVGRQLQLDVENAIRNRTPLKRMF